jgi:hypothetical protein
LCGPFAKSTEGKAEFRRALVQAKIPDNIIAEQGQSFDEGLRLEERLVPEDGRGEVTVKFEWNRAVASALQYPTKTHATLYSLRAPKLHGSFGDIVEEVSSFIMRSNVPSVLDFKLETFLNKSEAIARAEELALMFATKLSANDAFLKLKLPGERNDENYVYKSMIAAGTGFALPDKRMIYNLVMITSVYCKFEPISMQAGSATDYQISTPSD